MLLKSRLILYAVLASVAVLQGCALGPQVNPDAFGQGKRFAVVSISAGHKIRSWDDPNQGSSLLSLAKAATKESGFSHDASDILNDTAPRFVDSLASYQGFKLLSPRQVVGSRSYKMVEADKSKMPLSKWISPPGYKHIAEKEKYQRLAAELNVDGVIAIQVQYGFRFSGVKTLVASAGKQRAVSQVAVMAFDRNGERIWADVVIADSDSALTAFGDSANFTKLHPLLIESSGKALQQVLDNLSKKLAG